MRNPSTYPHVWKVLGAQNVEKNAQKICLRISLTQKGHEIKPTNQFRLIRRPGSVDEVRGSIKRLQNRLFTGLLLFCDQNKTGPVSGACLIANLCHILPASLVILVFCACFNLHLVRTFHLSFLVTLCLYKTFFLLSSLTFHDE